MLESGAEIDGFAAELIDRFGPLPVLVENWLEVMTIKRLCRDAGVARIEAGATGAVLSFQDDRFANPAGLVAFIGGQTVGTKLRPDHSLLIPGDWGDAAARLKGVREILAGLADIAKT